MNAPLPRIGIDARLYGPANGGLGRYIAELIKHLEISNPAAEFRIFLTRKNWEHYEPTNPKFKKVLADVPWYGLAEQLTLARIFKNEHLDLLHVPHWNVPLLYRDPFVVTIHDILLLHHPTRQASTLGPLKYWVKNKAFRVVLRHAILHSQHILVPSEFTKNDIITTCAAAPHKITVTPLAALSEQTPPNTAYDTAVRARYNLTTPYVLYVGVAFPHKNLPRLLAAWKLVEQQTSGRWQLVLAGKPNYFYQQLMQSNAWHELAHARYLQFVPDADLPSIYRGASCYVHPSLYEGSALPAFEALSNNIPVVASRTTCLPELLGEAASYCNPNDATDIAHALLAMLTNPEIKKNTLAHATALLARSSWKNVAASTWEVYKNSVY